MNVLDTPDYFDFIGEVEQAAVSDNKDGLFEEIGDLLFSCVNVSRFAGIDPEEALTAATDKFLNRFSLVEKQANEEALELKNISPEKYDEMWEKAKNN